MTTPFSNDAEAFIVKVISDGIFASRDEVLEAAVMLMKLQTERIPFVPAEHMDGVEAAIDSLEKHGGIEFTPEYLEQMKSRISALAAAERARAAS